MRCYIETGAANICQIGGRQLAMKRDLIGGVLSHLHQHIVKRAPLRFLFRNVRVYSCQYLHQFRISFQNASVYLLLERAHREGNNDLVLKMW